MEKGQKMKIIDNIKNAKLINHEEGKILSQKIILSYSAQPKASQSNNINLTTESAIHKRKINYHSFMTKDLILFFKSLLTFKDFLSLLSICQSFRQLITLQHTLTCDNSIWNEDGSVDKLQKFISKYYFNSTGKPIFLSNKLNDNWNLLDVHLIYFKCENIQNGTNLNFSNQPHLLHFECKNIGENASLTLANLSNLTFLKCGHSHKNAILVFTELEKLIHLYCGDFASNASLSVSKLPQLTHLFCGRVDYEASCFNLKLLENLKHLSIDSLTISEDTTFEQLSKLTHFHLGSLFLKNEATFDFDYLPFSNVIYFSLKWNIYPKFDLTPFENIKYLCLGEVTDLPKLQKVTHLSCKTIHEFSMPKLNNLENLTHFSCKTIEPESTGFGRSYKKKEIFNATFPNHKNLISFSCEIIKQTHIDLSQLEKLIKVSCQSIGEKVLFKFPKEKKEDLIFSYTNKEENTEIIWG